MDVNLYEVVLSYRRGQRLSNRVEYGFNEAQLALRQDMAKGRLVWYDDWLQDWWCFLRNTHPVFAAFASHQLHVVGKIERYWIYGMLICAYWLMAALSIETRECMREPKCDPSTLAASPVGLLKHMSQLAFQDLPERPDDLGSPGDYDGSLGGAYGSPGVISGLSPDSIGGVDFMTQGVGRGSGPPDMYMCCMVQNIGLVRMYREMGGGFVSLVFAVLTVTMGQFWFALASCSSCQNKSPAVRHRWERGAHLFLFVFGVVCATSFAVAYKYMASARLLGDAWLTFGLVKGASITGAFVLQSLLFVYLYRKQLRMSEDELSRMFHVTVADVRKCDAVRTKLRMPPLDMRFRCLNAVLPDVRNWGQRWRLYLHGLGLRQLLAASAWCVCALWLAATLIAAGTMVGVYVGHHRHYYPQLYRYPDSSTPGQGLQKSGYEYRAQGYISGQAGLIELSGAINSSLPILEIIRQGGER